MPPLDSRREKPRAAAPTEPATQQRALAALLVALLSLTGLLALNNPQRGMYLVGYALLAGVGILLSAVLLLAFAVFGPQLSAYGRCLSEAGTPTAQQACQAQLTHALNREMSALRAANQG